MELIKTIAILSLFILATTLLLFLALPFFFISLFVFKQTMGGITYKLAQCAARVGVFLTGCSMTVTGRENIPKKGRVCFVANHVGIFDILIAVAYSGRSFGFIAKKELRALPVFNLWILLLGGLFIDRKKPRKAIKTINKGINRIKEGGAMLIFPEGTRSRGRGIGNFLPGALKLATQSEALIIPVAISGSYEIFEEKYRVHSAPVSIHFLPPVNPMEISSEDRKITLAERLHDDIAEVLEQQKT